MGFLRHRTFAGRVAATLMLIVFVAAGLVLIFTGTLTRSTDIEARAELARAEVAALEARKAAGRAELEFLDQDGFVEQFARSIGFGERGERPFALQQNAPSPEPVIPLGQLGADQGAQAPFDAWMELLFGA